MPSKLALIAHASQVDGLIHWMQKHSAVLSAFQILTTPALAQQFQLHPLTASLSTQLIEANTSISDIQLAAQIIAGDVAGVIFFADPERENSESLTLDVILRACYARQVPLALNTATAELAIRGLARSRVAHLIFNPVAGRGNPNADLALIRSTLEPQVLVNVIMTQPDVNPADQAQEAVAKIQARNQEDSAPAMIIASGGDGTVSAVASAVIGTGIPLGVIPRGTANAFSVALGIPTDLKGACDTILTGTTRVVDAARCNNIPMILLAGLGFEAGMVDRATRELKDRLGTLAYVLAGAQQFVNQTPFQITIDVDGKVSELQAGALTVANVAPPGSVLAQGFGQVTPDDGLLEVTIATSNTRLQGLNALASLAASAVVKTPTQREDLLCLRAKKVKVTTDPPQKLVIDGEILAANPIEFECLPKSLTVFAPWYKL